VLVNVSIALSVYKRARQFRDAASPVAILVMGCAQSQKYAADRLVSLSMLKSGNGHAAVSSSRLGPENDSIVLRPIARNPRQMPSENSVAEPQWHVAARLDNPMAYP